MMVLFCLTLSFGASSSPVGKTKISRKGNVISIQSGIKQYQIEICNPSMFRVRLAGPNGFEANEPWIITQYNWAETPFSFSEKNDVLEIRTSVLTAKIRTNPVHISFYTLQGDLINQDDPDVKSMVYTAEGPLCNKQLQPGEHFYGFGERMDFIDQLGKKLKLDVGRGTARDHESGAYNILEANYAPVPFFLSTNGYGIFLHNANPSSWDMGLSSAKKYSFGASGGELDYYFLYGPSFKEILREYTALTGTSPLLPRAAMGLHVGTYSGVSWGFE